MSLKYILDDIKIFEKVFIAPQTTLIGKVTVGKNSSVWYQAVLRGDTDEIIVGENSNIQDGAILHCVNGFPVIIGNNVSVGHGAILHGCILGDNILVGMNATVLTGAKIGDNCLIGSGAVVGEGVVIPPNSFVVGLPAKIKSEITEKQKELIKETAENYVQYAIQYMKKR